jgi:hypothetical protein
MKKEFLRKNGKYLYCALAFVARVCQTCTTAVWYKDVVHFEQGTGENKKWLFIVSSDGQRMHIAALLSEDVRKEIGDITGDWKLRVTKDKITFELGVSDKKYPNWQGIIGQDNVLSEPAKSGSDAWWRLNSDREGVFVEGVFVDEKDISYPLYLLARSNLIVNSIYLTNITFPIGKGFYDIYQRDPYADYVKDTKDSINVAYISNMFSSALLFKRCDLNPSTSSLVAVIMPKNTSCVSALRHPMHGKEGLEKMVDRLFKKDLYGTEENLIEILQEKYPVEFK